MPISLRPLAGGIARALAFILLFVLLDLALLQLFGGLLDAATQDQRVS